MIDYTWTIAQLERQTDTGGVVVAHWRLTAVDGDVTASAYGTAGFTPDPTAPNFKPYDQLTEADVIGWLHASEGFDKEQIETGLQTQIDTLKNPPVVAGVPW